MKRLFFFLKSVIAPAAIAWIICSVLHIQVNFLTFEELRALIAGMLLFSSFVLWEQDAERQVLAQKAANLAAQERLYHEIRNEAATERMEAESSKLAMAWWDAHWDDVQAWSAEVGSPKEVKSPWQH